MKKLWKSWQCLLVQIECEYICLFYISPKCNFHSVSFLYVGEKKEKDGAEEKRKEKKKNKGRQYEHNMLVCLDPYFLLFVAYF